MSIQHNDELRRHREALEGALRNLQWLLLMIGGLVVWLVLRPDPTPTQVHNVFVSPARTAASLAISRTHRPFWIFDLPAPDVASPVLPPLQRPRTDAPDLYAEKRCWVAQHSYKSGSYRRCDVDQQCDWRASFGHDSDALTAYLDKRSKNPGLLVVYAGHDADPLRADNAELLDSNFDLAARRADAVLTTLTPLLGKEWTGMSIPSGKRPVCEEAHIADGDALARRTPVIITTVWEPRS